MSEPADEGDDRLHEPLGERQRRIGVDRADLPGERAVVGVLERVGHARDDDLLRPGLRGGERLGVVGGHLQVVVAAHDEHRAGHGADLALRVVAHMRDEEALHRGVEEPLQLGCAVGHVDPLAPLEAGEDLLGLDHQVHARRGELAGQLHAQHLVDGVGRAGERDDGRDGLGALRGAEGDERPLAVARDNHAAEPFAGEVVGQRRSVVDVHVEREVGACRGVVEPAGADRPLVVAQ